MTIKHRRFPHEFFRLPQKEQLRCVRESVERDQNVGDESLIIFSLGSRNGEVVHEMKYRYFKVFCAKVLDAPEGKVSDIKCLRF